MVIQLSPELEAALKESARGRGVTPEELANMVLRQQFLSDEAPASPHDQWERDLLAIASDCGVSLPNEALSSDALYE